MKEFLWQLVAKVVSIPVIAEYLIIRAQRTPYFHLDGYMNRWWLFNRYSEVGKQDKIPPRSRWLPSIRIHQILREDRAEHMHDHPWDGRTIILKGWYLERREDGKRYMMEAGDTRPIKFGEYHHIEDVGWMDTKCDGTMRSVYTMFITWGYKGTWGFLVDGKKVHYKQYLSEHPERA